MEYSDQNEYLRRAKLLDDVAQQHPAIMKAVVPDDRTVLEQYYLGGLQAKDPIVYRSEQLKHDPNIEKSAGRAWERFMADAGMSEVLSTAPESR